MTEIPLSMSFEEYVNLQKRASANESPAAFRHPAFHALQHGRYSVYLKPFVSAFERPRIYVAFYEELQRDPHLFMALLCQWVGLDDSYFREYRFQVTNKGVRMRSPRINRLYYKARQGVRRLVRNTSSARAVFRSIGGGVNAVYRKLNVAERENVSMSSSTEEFLGEYYLQERARLEEMLGIPIPWPYSRKPDASGIRDHEVEAMNAIKSEAAKSGLDG